MPGPGSIAGTATPSSWGLVNTAISTLAGNTLVAVVACHVLSTSWATSSVTDSANNTWHYGGSATTTATGNTMIHLSVWYATNTKAVSYVQATIGGVTSASAAAIYVYEVGGISNTSPTDGVSVTFSNGTTSVTPSTTTTNSADFVIAACAIANYGVTVTHSADSYTTETEVSAQTGGWYPYNDIRLDTAYKVTSSSGTQSTTWTFSGSTPAVSCIIAMRGGSTSTTNTNPVYPQLSAKVAFGTAPNAGAFGVYTYGTDVSSYVTEFNTRRGVPYELGQTEAGEQQVTLYNQDGRFDPTNTSSPYYPNVKDFVPYQMTATWSGVTYGVFTGYMESWPQEWNDNRIGFSKATGVDTYATLARTKLKSCMQQEVLQDNPWGYWPLGDAQGSAFAANIATGSGQSVAIYPVPPMRPGKSSADFGVQVTPALAGDNGTAWGQATDQSQRDQGWSLGTGGAITGATFPATSSAPVVEVWARYEPQPQLYKPSTLIALKASGTSWSRHTVAQLLVSQFSTARTGNLQVVVFNSSGTATTYDTGWTSPLADGRWHHYALGLNASGTANVWLDGSLVYTSPSAATTAQIDTIDVGGTQDPWESAYIGIGAYAHLAVYPNTPSAARMLSHYKSGHDGFPEDSGARINRLLTYAGWQGGRNIDKGNAVLAGCSTIAGQNIADAIADVVDWEYGLAFVDGLGNFRFRNRASRFNQTSKGTLGDGTGENHYQATIKIDNDPTYQYNDIEITRLGPGSTQGITQLSGDPSNTNQQYFTSSLQQSVNVLSDAQAADRATFLYNLLSVTQPRIDTIQLDPVADPTLWPVVLGMEVGDRWTIKRRPVGSTNTLITFDVVISEISHDVAVNKWLTTLRTLPASSATIVGGVSAWSLDDPVKSVLGTSTIPGFALGVPIALAALCGSQAAALAAVPALLVLLAVLLPGMACRAGVTEWLRMRHVGSSGPLAVALGAPEAARLGAPSVSVVGMTGRALRFTGVAFRQLAACVLGSRYRFAVARVAAPSVSAQVVEGFFEDRPHVDDIQEPVDEPRSSSVPDLWAKLSRVSPFPLKAAAGLLRDLGAYLFQAIHRVSVREGRH